MITNVFVIIQNVSFEIFLSRTDISRMIQLAKVFCFLLCCKFVFVSFCVDSCGRSWYVYFGFQILPHVSIGEGYCPILTTWITFNTSMITGTSRVLSSMAISTTMQHFPRRLLEFRLSLTAVAGRHFFALLLR